MKKNKKKEHKKMGFIESNKKAIVAFIGGALITGAVCGFFWPDRIAKLSDGSDMVASINGTNVSADALYRELSSRAGLSILLDMVDKEILLNKYNLKDEASAYAQEQSASYYEQWQSIYGFTKEDFLKNNGFSDEQEFLDYLEFEFYKNHYLEDYLNSKVKDEDVQKYYDDVVRDERTISVFYTTGDSKDLNKIKKAIEKGTKIEKITKKYPSVSYREIGAIDFNSYNQFTDKFITEMNKLEKGKVSKAFLDDNFGNVIIYVTDVKEKASFDELKDQIRTNLANQIRMEDQMIIYRAFQDLRSEYGFEIADQNLKKEYDNFVEETKANKE